MPSGQGQARGLPPSDSFGNPAGGCTPREHFKQSNCQCAGTGESFTFECLLGSVCIVLIFVWMHQYGQLQEKGSGCQWYFERGVLQGCL